MVKKIIVLIIGLVFFFIAGVSVKAILFALAPKSNDPNVEELIIEVKSGQSLYAIARNLEDLDVISSQKNFVWMARILGQSNQARSGEYNVSANMSPKKILDIITSGKSVLHSITIPEGHNIYEIRNLLNAKWEGRGDEFYSHVTDPSVVKKHLGEEYRSLEGYLFPNTYQITRFTTAEQMVNSMVAEFRRAYGRATENAQLTLPLHDHVTLASIIEKETGAPWERALISSVFHNRIKKRMRLQSDPTILYGMLVETGVIPTRIRRVDIRNPNTYNTYTISGLPEGPIANPGLEALAATLNPEESDYLFFVSRNDGTHVFSKNYDDHRAAVRKYQLDPSMREGRSWRDLSDRVNQ